MLLAVLVGCAPRDPWGPALALPDRVVDVRSSLLLVGGVPAGIEERTTGWSDGHTVVVRRRTWSFLVDGAVGEVRGGSRTEHDGVHVTAWSDGVRSFVGETWVLDVFPPPATGVWPILDPGTGEVRDLSVEVDGGTVSWSAGGAGGRATFEGGHLVSASLGTFSLVPAGPGAVVVPVDPAAAWSVPVAVQDAPAHPVVASFRVGGREVTVTSPLPEELPRDLLRTLRTLVRDTGTKGDCEAHVARFVRSAEREGLEVRPVAGLALDRARWRMVPHAWAEVRVGDIFVAVDPTWGLAPADAARLTFGVASRADVVARMASGEPVELLRLR